ncbi:glycosyltransferase [uncultured Treponema sp.]|uniref:glycosyltransferase n=1 Tax=uncultured Treponema sp. TaxID=162155 RepID=UPI0025E592F0|nr:glycosyltransferase [uncultured Treponema sp.]
MKVLFISKDFNQSQANGGSVVSKRNYDLFLKLFGKGNVDLYVFPVPTFVSKVKGILFNRDYGITKKIENEIKTKISSGTYNYVFFNSSLFGNLIEYCRNCGSKTIVFFHNIEKKYYHDMYKYHKSILTWFFFLYVSRLEKKSCLFSDCKIVLNKRDAEEMQKEYSVLPELILPISMDSHVKLIKCNNSKKGKCGFIGSDMFANKDGVLWFIQNVLPHINKKFVVAGSMCDYLKERLSANYENLEMLGRVNNVDDFYNSVEFVVSPIFLGSGMKTKSVEALSYGIPIVGTKEAFVGIDYKDIGELCKDSSEFVEKINNFDISKYNEQPYKYFEKNLSNSVVLERLKTYIEGCEK